MAELHHITHNYALQKQSSIIMPQQTQPSQRRILWRSSSTPNPPGTMKLLTIKAFAAGTDKPVIKKLSVVKDPDVTTLREHIGEKINQALPSFFFSAAEHIARVVATNDDTDVFDLLDFPVSLLLGHYFDSRPEISLTIDNGVASLQAPNKSNINSNINQSIETSSLAVSDPGNCCLGQFTPACASVPRMARRVGLGRRRRPTGASTFDDRLQRKLHGEDMEEIYGDFRCEDEGGGASLIFSKSRAGTAPTEAESHLSYRRGRPTKGGNGKIATSVSSSPASTSDAHLHRAPPKARARGHRDALTQPAANALAVIDMNSQDIDKITVKAPMPLVTTDCKSKTLAQPVAKAITERNMYPQDLKKSKVKAPMLLVSMGCKFEVDNISVMTLPAFFPREPETPVRDREHYQDCSSDIATLQSLVEDFTEAAAGSDGDAIALITEILIKDNSQWLSLDASLFCLNTLWVLACKSDENKRKIIFEGATLEMIIEAMFVYLDASAEIQTRACKLLWALSIDVEDRVHVAQSGACKAIRRAMARHAGEVSLQLAALGCLKALSSSRRSRRSMRPEKTSSVVADVMREHVRDPAVQSEGCAVLGNLTAIDEGGFVRSMTAGEVGAVVDGMRAHPGEAGVREAACSALMRFASSAVNVELIRGNGLSQATLEQALKKHPDKVGSNILILLRRLRYDAPAADQGG